jgi:hypothetical protein
MKILLMLLLPCMALAQNLKSVPAPTLHAYSPLGFDSNDNTEIAIEGYLPNLCFQAPLVNWKRSGNYIDVRVQAIHNQNGLMCPEVIVPFLETASFGVLPPGLYHIRVNAGTQYEKKTNLIVDQAPVSKIDDHIYAHISSIERVDMSRRLRIVSTVPSPCLKLKEIKAKSNGVDTISVLPIMEYDDKKGCEKDPKKQVFFYTIPDEFKDRDSVLIHIRSMEGKSKNFLFKQY